MVFGDAADMDLPDSDAPDVLDPEDVEAPDQDEPETEDEAGEEEPEAPVDDIDFGDEEPDPDPAPTADEPDWEAQVQHQKASLQAQRHQPVAVAYPNGIQPREQDPRPEDDDPMALLAWQGREMERIRVDNEARRRTDALITAEELAIAEEGPDWARRLAFFAEVDRENPELGLAQKLQGAPDPVTLLRKWTNRFGFQASQPGARPKPRATPPAPTRKSPPQAPAPRQPRSLGSVRGTTPADARNLAGQVERMPQAAFDRLPDDKRMRLLRGY